MTLPPHKPQEEHCTTTQQSWTCPNMKPLENDRDMQYEHYYCVKCERRMKLDYDEMR